MLEDTSIESHNVIEPSDSLVGKRFPLWVIRTFEDLIMGKDIVKEGEDPCRVITSTKKMLRPYQLFLSRYLSLRQFRGLLVYHGLGSGKTAGAVHLIGVLNNKYDTPYNVVILLPASLQTTWRNEISQWLPEHDKYSEYIHFISTNAPNLETQFFDMIKKLDTTRNTLYMVDECHNFISNVHSNILSGHLKSRASVVYDYIQNDLQINPHTKVVLLSGTPIRSDVFELSLIFNLLRPGALPKNESVFQSMFMEKKYDEDVPTLKSDQKFLFQRRIAGLVSYFRGSSPLLYAKKQVFFLNLRMDPKQEDIYSYFRAIEKKAEASAIQKRGKSMQSFRTSSRLSGNFVFPENGVRRPKPSMFRLSSKDEERLMSGKELKDDQSGSSKQYIEACKEFLGTAKKYFKKVSTDDNQKLLHDIKRWKDTSDKNFEQFRGKEGLSRTFTELSQCSVKMTAALFIAAASPGPCVIYSQFVLMEGLEVMKMYLDIGGITSVGFHGGIDKNERYKNLENFNNGKVDVMLLSGAGSEGLTLKNVRTVIILEPSWSEDTVQQVIGRAIRQCSHKDLPMEDRVVSVYRLKSLESQNNRSTDEHVEESALRRHAQKLSFLEALQEVAVDCDLFKNQNHQTNPCFRFPVSDVMKERSGPMFHKDIIVDAEKEVKYKVKKLKVRKIKGIVDNKVGQYYLDEETGVVYDTNHNFPVGVVYRDNQGFFEKVDADTFMISDHVKV